MIKNKTLVNTIFHFMSIKGIGPVQTNKLLISLPDLSELTLQKVAYQLLTDKQKEEFEGIKDAMIEIKTKFNVDFTLLHENDYPKYLKLFLSTNAPPILSSIGNIKLLNKCKVAFSGSRNVSQKGIKITEDSVKELIMEDVVIISGYAKGVDFTAHHTALKNGGSTIIILPEGINHFRIKSEYKDVWDWNRVLVISEFLPSEKWMASRAMKRNGTIIAISDALIVVEAGTTGGSLDAGFRALEMNKALFVPQYSVVPESAEGNVLLLNRGAQSLKMSKETLKPNISKVMKTIRNGERYSLF